MASYDKAREYERAFAAKARDIAKVAGWEARFPHATDLSDNGEPLNGVGRPVTYAILSRKEDALAVSLSLDTYKGRLVARPAVPSDESGRSMSLRDWGVIGWNDATPEATFAFDRAPEAIAREIGRKVVAPYAPMLTQIQERLKQRRDTAFQARATLVELATIFGEKVKPDALRSTNDSETLYVSGVSGASCVVRGYGTVEFKISLSDPDKARALAIFIRDVLGDK